MIKQTHSVPQFIPVGIRMKLINDYLNQGLDLDQIGNLFGVSGGAIRYHLYRYGGLMKPVVKKSPIKPKPAIHDKRGKMRYVLKMRKEGLTYKEIGNLLGVSIERARQIYMKGTRIENHRKRPLSIYNTIDVYANFLKEIASSGTSTPCAD